MNMKDFHAWVKAGNFDKPKMGDDSAHTARLQETNKDVLSTIAKISGQKPNTQPRTNLTETMTSGPAAAGPPERTIPYDFSDPYNPSKPTPLSPQDREDARPIRRKPSIEDMPYFTIPNPGNPLMPIRIKNPSYRDR